MNLNEWMKYENWFFTFPCPFTAVKSRLRSRIFPDVIFKTLADTSTYYSLLMQLQVVEVMLGTTMMDLYVGPLVLKVKDLRVLAKNFLLNWLPSKLKLENFLTQRLTRMSWSA